MVENELKKQNRPVIVSHNTLTATMITIKKQEIIAEKHFLRTLIK